MLPASCCVREESDAREMDALFVERTRHIQPVSHIDATAIQDCPTATQRGERADQAPTSARPHIASR